MLGTNLIKCIKPCRCLQFFVLIYEKLFASYSIDKLDRVFGIIIITSLQIYIDELLWELSLGFRDLVNGFWKLNKNSTQNYISKIS